MYVRPSAPLDIGGVIDDAIRLYRASFGRSWLLGLGFALVLAALQLAALLALPGLMATVGRGAAANPQRLLAALVSPQIVVGYVVVLLASMVFYGALFALEAGVVRGDRSVTVGRALVKGLRRLPGMLLATFVFLIAVCIGAAVFFLPIPRLLSVLLLLIVAIYLWGKFQLWQPSMFTEDASAIESLGNSWRVTQGRWWRSVTIFTVAVIVAYILTLAVQLIGTAVAAIVATTQRNPLQAQLFALPFSMAARVIVTPVLPAVLLAIYNDCKLRSEGGDLAARVGTLGGA